ncbi:type I 3-dehydroquinate dehydratase [Chryseomicrobium palamuruense]|uniref:3-dehydroquinate dehydratase n=1 Tax=Chryseomicrobium palamuruense TaxID=682973 RepID=A0ABV8UUC9_9BACL
MRNVMIRDVIIGQGAPKIIVSLISSTRHNLVEEIEHMAPKQPDIWEWRLDFQESFEGNELTETLALIRELTYPTPLLVTYRTNQEGGHGCMKGAAYSELLTMTAASGFCDLVDVELFSEDSKELVHAIQQHNCKVIVSNHDFDRTPPKEELIWRLREMQLINGDIGKIAVMPKRPQDVLSLLDAAEHMKEHYADRPFIVMSMGNLGAITRLGGHHFGSAATFAAGASPSAPGQLPIELMKQLLK